MNTDFCKETNTFIAKACEYLKGFSDADDFQEALFLLVEGYSYEKKLNIEDADRIQNEIYRRLGV